MNILQLKQAAEPELLKIPGVNGVGIQQGEITVYVEKRDPRTLSLIPGKINQAKVKVVELGKLELVQKRSDKWRPAPAGVSIGHPTITAGTLGLPVKKNGETFILSNNHVLAAMDSIQNTRASYGDSIYQPGAYDGGTEADKIGYLDAWVKWDEQGPNYVDCALAKPVAGLLNEVLGLGALTQAPAPPVQPIEGMFVQKSGRTTGVTSGTLLDTNITVTINSWIGELLFKDQLLSNLHIEGGDSGSFVFDAQGNPVGLAFAGSDTYSIFNKAANVASALGITYPKLEVVPRKVYGGAFPIPFALGGIILLTAE